jgi:hypothetical protein
MRPVTKFSPTHLCTMAMPNCTLQYSTQCTTCRTPWCRAWCTHCDTCCTEPVDSYSLYGTTITGTPRSDLFLSTSTTIQPGNTMDAAKILCVCSRKGQHHLVFRSTWHHHFQLASQHDRQKMEQAHVLHGSSLPYLCIKPLDLSPPATSTSNPPSHRSVLHGRGSS